MAGQVPCRCGVYLFARSYQCEAQEHFARYFLKDGLTQATKHVTNITVGDTSTSWLSSGEMTYQAGLLTRFKQAIHTKKKVADKVQESDSVHTKKLIYSCPKS